MDSNSSSLFSLAHDLLTYGLDGSPIYADQFARLNRDVYERAIELYNTRGTTVEEEAELCLGLLVAFAATIYDNGDKEQKKQIALNRACELLGRLPASLLKVRLLAYTYGEVYEESLLQEAHTIVDSWDKEAMITEQVEAVKELRNIEENPYPFEEVEE